jgi:twitching motility protein PilT
MHDQRADALHLAVGKPASLIQNGGVRHLTREPLSDAQIQALLREIASPETAAQLGSAGPLSFAYRSPSGEVQVEVKAGNSGNAMVRPVGAAVREGAAGIPPVAPAPAARQAQDLAGPRAELEALFRNLVESGASDLHLRTGEPPMLRNHGELARQSHPPLSADKLDAMLVSIMTPKELGEFREGGDTDWAYEITGIARFRCNAGRDRYGPMAVFRVIPNQIRTADEMGLSREVQNLCYLTKGLVVVTGPTGSGKSTTLAGLVDLINRNRTDHIITIEDPIEFVHPSKKCLVTQRQVGVHTRSFKHALRAALREDPDIILVGEMRDRETIAAALTAAETGHLVLSTLHCGDASSAVHRIVDVFPEHQQQQVREQLASSLRAVVTQMLLPALRGPRVAAYELMLVNVPVATKIREQRDHQLRSEIQKGRNEGMIPLELTLARLVRERRTSEDTARSVASDARLLDEYIRQR